MPYASGRFHRAQIALGREEEMLVSQFTKERLGAASAVAASLECRFGTSYVASDIVMASGADSALNAFMDAVLKPEDEVIAFAPCGQTYRAIVEDRGARLVEVPLDEETMLPDFVAPGVHAHSAHEVGNRENAERSERYGVSGSCR